MKSLNYTESIPYAGKYDVIVVGGGLGGIAAALSAARKGAQVLLMEKRAELGGLATLGLVNLWVPLCNGYGKQVIRGMAEEFLRLSILHGFDTLPDEWRSGEPKTPTRVRYTTKFSMEIFALELIRLLTDSGVEVMYETLLSAPVMENTRCTGLIADTLSGRQYFETSCVVDATGDATVFSKAGAKCVDGRNFFTMAAKSIDLEHCKKAVEMQNIRYAYYSTMGGEATLSGQGHPEGMPVFIGCGSEVVNDYLQKNQLALLQRLSKQPRLSRDIAHLPGMAQLRTARCIQGDATLTTDMLFKHCDTSIGAICDFGQSGNLYEVPYGTLVCKGFDNLITCGRCASASGYAWDVLRVIPPAVITGQAAGVAAAQCVKNKLPIGQQDIKLLQETLEKDQVLIHFPDEWIQMKESDGEISKLDNF